MQPPCQIVSPLTQKLANIDMLSFFIQFQIKIHIEDRAVFTTTCSPTILRLAKSWITNKRNRFLRTDLLVYLRNLISLIMKQFSGVENQISTTALKFKSIQMRHFLSLLLKDSSNIPTFDILSFDVWSEDKSVKHMASPYIPQGAAGAMSSDLTTIQDYMKTHISVCGDD